MHSRDNLRESWHAVLLPTCRNKKKPTHRLCSVNSYSSHGDFINGWLPEAANNMLLANSKGEFATVTGPLGSGNTKSSCASPKDAEPSKGTSDYLISVGLLKPYV